MNEVRIGIIGVGNIGSAHARNILDGKIPGMRLTALCDIDADRRDALKKQFPEIPVFETAEALLASGLTDGVIIATPHYFHPEIAMAAFEAGQHVLTEKPAGVRVSDVVRMNEAADISGKVFGIMFNQRTDPLFAKAREIVQSGALGQRKRFVWIVTNWYRSQAYDNSGGWRATWQGEGGGVLLNQAPHNLDLWQWIFGMPARIRAFCTPGKYHHISVEDDATIYAEYADGSVATFITTTGEAPGTNRLEISGDRGKLVLEQGSLTWYRMDESERAFCYSSSKYFYMPEIHKEVYTAEPVVGHMEILKNFTRRILYGEPLIAPGQDGLNSLNISNSAYLSAWTEDWSDIPVDTALFDQMLRTQCDRETEISKSSKMDVSEGNYSERWQVRW